MTHALRKSYLAGCRCLPCRVANAQYMAAYRQRLRAGHVILGARISADIARRLLDQLHRDSVPKTVIAHALGLRSPGLKVHARITVRRHLKIQRVHRRYMSESAEPDELGI